MISDTKRMMPFNSLLPKEGNLDVLRDEVKMLQDAFTSLNDARESRELSEAEKMEETMLSQVLQWLQVNEDNSNG